MLKRTPALAILIAILITLATVKLFQIDARPFTKGEIVLLYIISLLPSLGFALLFDPASRKAKEEYLKINFYEEK